LSDARNQLGALLFTFKQHRSGGLTMRIQHIGLLVMTLGASLAGHAALADETAQQKPIAGADVMGDKGRSGPDGWSWAPVTRDQGASEKAAGQSATNASAAPNAQPDPNAGKTLAAGDDPGTPMAHQPNGPSTQDKSASTRTP